jgi:hypothetical protein
VRQVGSYRKRVESVGSGLHERKSFLGRRGWTFCETFGLRGPSGRVRFFNPHPLKQFMKDGNGVMDKAQFDVIQWPALRRVARVLCKAVRAKARRLGRPPELPAQFGGLGHPSKGMRDMPKVVRSQLYNLCYGDTGDPSKYANRIDTFFAPSDPRMFELARAAFGADVLMPLRKARSSCPTVRFVGMWLRLPTVLIGRTVESIVLVCQRR